MTMTKYTDYSYLHNSSAIDEVFYDAEDKYLLLVFVSGGLAAYEDVAPEVFRAFKLQDESENGSAGRYYNDVRPYLRGTEAPDPDDLVDATDRVATDEPELVAQAPVEDDPADNEDEVVVQAAVESKVAAGEYIISKDKLVSFDFYVPVTNQYTVAFEYTADNNTYELELDVYAPNPDAALNRFGAAVEILGYRTVKVNSLTRHFN